jgi:hypothetical protein
MTVWRKLVILSYGMGVDSTAILWRWLVDPSSRDFELADLVVLTAQVGSEFPGTKRLVEQHLFPMLRAAGVRFVEVGRSGPSTTQWRVIQDSHEPTELHIEGAGFTLLQELLTNGTVPQRRKNARQCSQKYKGVVLDAWIAAHTHGRPFRHVMGFNADEQKRADRDESYSTEQRDSEYPLLDWGWGRKRCEDYLAAEVGEQWQKSCCTFCPFACNKAGIQEHLVRLRVQAPEAAHTIRRMERVSRALNEKQSLYSWKGGAEAQLDAAGFGPLEAPSWALYHVRRVWHKECVASRALVVAAEGSQTEMDAELEALAAAHGAELVEVARSRCAVVTPRPASRKGPEELFAVAPAGACAKQRPSFEATWEASQ